jgi:hypothetical protein
MVGLWPPSSVVRPSSSISHFKEEDQYGKERRRRPIRRADSRH